MIPLTKEDIEREIEEMMQSQTDDFESFVKLKEAGKKIQMK